VGVSSSGNNRFILKCFGKLQPQKWKTRCVFASLIAGVSRKYITPSHRLLHIQCNASGPAGVLLLHTELPYRPEYVETGEDAVTLILHEARDQRTAIHGAYFPYRGGQKHKVAGAIERIAQHAAARERQVVIGDLNLGSPEKPRREFSEYEAHLYQAGLLRLQAPRQDSPR